MTRKEFIKACGLLGISLPFGSVVNACNPDNSSNTSNQISKVLIIGAGAAGMSAGYLLQQQGIDFEILEASSNYGGRIKHTRDFANFPISLGGEWIHVASSILSEAVNNTSVQISTQTIGYQDNDTIGFYDGNNYSESTLRAGFGEDYSDLKFVGSSWLDFFETYILPSISNKITYNSPIVSIDYSSDHIKATTNGGAEYTAERIIVTIPIKQLQNTAISFTPALPSNKLSVVQSLTVWSGFKAFIKFSSKFYPTFLTFPDSENSVGQRLYYDAAYGQNTNEHILGLFSVGQQAETYQNFTGNALRDHMLNELDAVFGANNASSKYIDHIVQNWNEEPYINAAYLTDSENWRSVRTMGESINNKLYFAGDGYTDGEDWSSVHTAIRSARRAITEMI